MVPALFSVILVQGSSLGGTGSAASSRLPTGAVALDGRCRGILPPRVGAGKVTGDEMVGADGPQHRLLARAALLGPRAPGAEPAAAGGIERRRHVAPNRRTR